ncbi:MAG TPA: ribbon-helix-helix protein, CopG family [Solirubrobacterales bacterium]|nr:ribbon-helix-helix protein, CopG family [Solirubrobacterales bacterium]
MRLEVSSLRLPEPVAKQLRSIAQANGISVAEVLRQAIENHVAEQVSDGEFKERLRKRLEEDREVLDALGTEE